MSDFRVLAQQFAEHIRDPELSPMPAGIEPRRATIYSELFFNNIESFAASAYPILRQLFDDDDWRVLIRNFLRHHRCETPYFLEIAAEFLAFLQSRGIAEGEPAFILELAHYEWLELALDIADEDIEQTLAEREIDETGDLLVGRPVVSPLACSVAYQYPVHRIGVDYQPAEPPAQPSYLVVYRDRQDSVKFMEANAVTARLLELLAEDGQGSGREVLLQLAADMQHPQPQQVVDSGLEIMQQLLQLDILLGITAA